MQDSLQNITPDLPVADSLPPVAAPRALDASEIFGGASELVRAAGGQTADGWAMGGGFAFQLLVVAVALVYLILILHYAELVAYFLSLTAGGGSTKQRRPTQHSASGGRSNCEVGFSVVGVAAIVLAAVRFGGEWISAAVPPLDNGWFVGGAVLAGVALLAAFQEGALYVFGSLSGQRAAFSELRAVKSRHFATAIALLFPFVAVALQASPGSAGGWLWTAAAICSILVLLFVKETFSLFRAQKVSILHWILYLCAVEAFPISLLLAPMLRG